METDNSNISDENEATNQLDSNDVSKDELINKIKNILKKGGDHHINQQKDKKIFDNLMKISNKIFSAKTLSQCYEQNISFEQLTKKIIKPNTTRSKILFMNYLVLPLFNIFYLIAVLQFLNMTSTFYKVVKKSFGTIWYSSEKDPEEIKKFSIEDFNKNYNFFNMFFEDTRKNIFDFNFIKVTAFIGTCLLQKVGFRISSSILCVAILIPILLIIFVFPFLDYYNFNNTYPYLYIIFLAVLDFSLLVGAGGSAMLAQQMIMDKRNKYNEYIVKLNKEEEIRKAKKKRKNKKIQIAEESNDTLITLRSPLFQENDIGENGMNAYNQETTDSNLHNSTNYDENITENSYNENDINNRSRSFAGTNYLNDNQVAIQRSKTTTLNDDAKKTLNEILKSIEERHDIELIRRKENKLDSLPFYFITTIFAHIGLFFINYSLLEKKEENNIEYMDISGCEKNYFCFQNIIKDKNLSMTAKDLFHKLNSRIYEDDRLYFIIIVLISFSFIIISHILYTIFDCSIFTKEKTTQNEDGIDVKMKIREIAGEMYFSLEIALKQKISAYILNLMLIKITILLNIIITILNSILLFIFDVFSFKEEWKSKLQIPKCCSEEIFKKDKTSFLIKYPRQTKSFYVNNFFSGKAALNISTYMIMYLYLQIMNLTFENENYKIQNKKEIFNDSPKLGGMFFLALSNPKDKNKNNNVLNIGNYVFLKTEDYFILITFVAAFFGFLYFTRVCHDIHILLKKIKKQDNINKSETNGNNENETKEEEEEEEEDKKEELSNGIFGGIYIIFYLEGIYILIFSILYLKNSKSEIFQNTCIYLFPILLNQFYYFTMVYYCTRYSVNINKYEIINGSFLISIWFVIIDLIVSYIRDYFDLENIYINSLCLLPIAGILIKIIIFLVNIKYFCCHIILKNFKKICTIIFTNLDIFSLKECCYDCFGCQNCLRCCYCCCCDGYLGSSSYEKVE